MKVWIYFLRGGSDGPIKVGYAQDPFFRAQDLSTGSPVELILLGAMMSERPRAEEQEIHDRLASYRVKGEWYEADAVFAEMQAHAQRILTPDDLQNEIEPRDDADTLSRNINIRCTPEEVALWRAAAEAEGKSLSAFIRARGNAAIEAGTV